jgi:hypothetical protein
VLADKSEAAPTTEVSAKTSARLSRVLPTTRLSALKEVGAGDYAARFLLGAVISMSAGIIGNTIGARFSGLFLAFPAILPASLTLVQEKEGTRDADRDAIGAILGAVGLVVFAGTAEATLGHIPSLAALGLALCAWLATSVALYAILATVAPEKCDKNRD